MKPSLIATFLSAFLFLPSTGVAEPVPIKEVASVLNLYTGEPSTWIIQRADRWCWSASAEIIMSSYGKTYWKQCIQADDAYPGKSSPRTCCDDPQSTFCNRTGWPHFEYYNFRFLNTTDNAALTWEQLKLEIDNQRPVAVAVHFNGGGGHMAVVAGYAVTQDGTQRVLLFDPDGFHGGVWSDYDDVFGTSSGLWYHWRDYYDIQPR